MLPTTIAKVAKKIQTKSLSGTARINTKPVVSGFS
jgi:hypothetical protein